MIHRRRDFLKLSAAAVGAVGLPLAARSAEAESAAPGSPELRRFVQPLKLPPSAERFVVPEAALDPPVQPEAHQAYAQFRPKKFYRVPVVEAPHRFHPDLPGNHVFAYGGSMPGPTFRARYHEPILVRLENCMPANYTGPGMPDTATHLHNLHTPSESDGFPGDFITPGQHRDQHYLMFCAGDDDREAMGTMWYHDHRIDHTAPNVYRGLFGFFLAFDEWDSGDENDRRDNALRLPSGQFDVPLVFTDPQFDSNGILYWDPFDMEGHLGDTYAVNGVLWPVMQVARRKYRFRLLDGGPSRYYRMFLSDDSPMTLIANDANLLPAPVEVQSVLLGVATRADVIMDFSRYKVGQSVYLENRLVQTSGRGPENALLPPGEGRLLRFDVATDYPNDGSRVPEKLRELPPIAIAQVKTQRTFVFERRNGAWTINGNVVDLSRPAAAVPQGSTEIWTLRNNSGSWSHPIHIHFEEFQTLSVNGRPPRADYAGRRDVALLGPNEEHKLFFRFRDFKGRYVMHCHNLVHEDHAMMLRWDIV